jgi:hypothetical protein
MCRRSSPSSSSRSKAYSMASVTVPRRWSASKIATRTAYLSVEGEGPGAQQHRSDGDRRIPAAPVVAAPGEEPHGIAVSSHLQPISVVLDLVHPAGSAGGFTARVGIQGAMKREAEGTTGIPFEYRLALPAGSPQNAAVECLWSCVPCPH